MNPDLTPTERQAIHRFARAIRSRLQSGADEVGAVAAVAAEMPAEYSVFSRLVRAGAFPGSLAQFAVAYGGVGMKAEVAA